MLTVEEVALREMRAQGHGWVCALWVQKQLHVFLAYDLEGNGRWIKKVVAGGGKESEPVRVDEERLERQHMVVMEEQQFFFFDTDHVDLFSDVMGGCTVGYAKGQQVLYVGGDGRRNATVVSVDDGESTVPSYTVEFGDGGPPRQATADELEVLVRRRPSSVVFCRIRWPGPWRRSSFGGPDEGESPGESPNKGVQQKSRVEQVAQVAEQVAQKLTFAQAAAE